MAKKLSKQQVRDYVDLYLWLKKEMKKPEWREFTAYIHGKAGYHDVADTYIKFIKEFESVTRGFVENSKIKKAEELTDLEIEHLSAALSNVKEDADLTRFNLMLGNVFGEDAGRYKALMTAMQAEARAAKLEELLAAEKAKNEQLKKEGKKVDDTIVNNIILALKKEYTTINASILDITSTISNQTTAINKMTKTNQRVLTEIHNTKQTVLTELSQIMLAVQKFNTDYAELVGAIQNIDVNITNINGGIDIIQKQNAEILALLRKGGAPSGGESTGVSKGWKIGAFVAGGLALAFIGTTLWASSYHDDLGLANQNANKANDTAIYWQDQYNILNNSYAQLNAQYQKLQDDYMALMGAPSQQALVKYINARQDLDVMIILALNDDKITQEEREKIVEMAQNITNIDITISLANPDLGNFISALLTSIDKFDLAVSTLNAKIVELEGIIANTEDKALIEKLTKEKEQLEQDKQSIIKEYNEYKASHTHSDKDVEKMKADYEAKLKEKAQEAIKLQGVVDELTEKLANAKTEEEYNKLLGEYNQAVANLELANKSWKDLYDAFETYKINTNTMIQDLRNTIAEHEQTIKNQQAVIDAFEAQGPASGITQEQYDAAVKAKEKAESALAAEQKAHKATQEKLNAANETIAATNAKLNNLSTAFEDFKANHNFTDEQYQLLQDAYDNLLDEYDNLREELANAKTEEEMKVIIEKLDAFQQIANNAYYQFYTVPGECSPEQLAEILSRLGFNVQQNPGDASPDIYQPAK